MKLPLQVWLLLFLRFMILLVLPFEAIYGYGDYPHFFELAQLAVDGGGGIPYVGHWVEFPPLFPFLSIGMYLLTGGSFHSYAYTLGLFMTVVDGINLLLFLRLSTKFFPERLHNRLTWVYGGFLLLPAFGWWTFDPLGVMFLLLGINAIHKGSIKALGAAAGFGVLTKLLPGMPLLISWRFLDFGKAIKGTMIATTIVVLGMGPFLIINPEFGVASFTAQQRKGSWETVWALLDGNLSTGSFGPIEDHLDPGQIRDPEVNDAAIPHWIITLIFAVVGIWFFFRIDGTDISMLVPFSAITLCLLFLWSRGWSPQWMAYMAPLLLLSLPTQRGIAFLMVLSLVSVMEWPVLLSRGRFDLMWLPIILRTFTFLILTVVLGERLEESKEKGVT